ncbi:MAG: homoserine dehydrogenase [Alistipes sp.]|nr:homoserine dehydrogenase [Alistipes sp.]MBQ8779070.1 homoserine dehydrogenase [Alistipes sp.]MBR6662571.1 homoserine dehydrogenase [Alistipes sp.]
MNGKKLNIGLFGFGTVGSGLYDVLKRIGSKNVEIKRICVRDLSKQRSVDAEFTDKADDIFNDPDINFIVELIDDADAAYTIVKRALQMSLPVVSGNKKMLAHHIEELIELQARYNVALLYDASACGSIPVIRNLEEYYDNDLLTSVKGILNGSSNFILSKIFNEKMSYADALKLAQDLGFAESNPTLDIDGWDSLFKLIIITIHAFGLYVAPEKIFTYGISNMGDDDIRFANEKERRFKLVAHVEKIAGNKLIMCVMPQLISRNKYIYSVEDEFNGVVIKGLFYDKQFMFGRGAGGYPTGSAVLSDITACLYDYKYEYKKRNDSQLPEYTTDHSFRVYYRYSDYADLDLMKFESVSENYISDSYKYVVGRVSLRELHRVQDELRKRNVFIAAYPND